MSMKDAPKDVWASGNAYEPYVGRWSRMVAKEFIHWLGLPDGQQWLDVGCGTGALTQTILENANPQKVKSIDRSEGYVEFARNQINDSRVGFGVGDAQSLPVDSETYD